VHFTDSIYFTTNDIYTTHKLQIDHFPEKFTTKNIKKNVLQKKSDSYAPFKTFSSRMETERCNHKLPPPRIFAPFTQFSEN